MSCTACGAPLPVNPELAQVSCPMCARWQEVSPAVRARAAEHARALAQVEAEREKARADANVQRRRARRLSLKRALVMAWALVLFIAGVFIWLPSFPFIVGAVAESYVEGYHEQAFLIVSAMAAVGEVVALALSVVLAVVTYRLYTRHARVRRARTGAALPQMKAEATCGLCGGPVAFQPDQHVTTCAYCRSVVLPTPALNQRLIGFALDQTQLARLEYARAERHRLRVELAATRESKLLNIGFQVGTGACVVFCAALPLFSIFYFWRSLSLNVEKALIALSDQWRGQFGAGVEPPFEWLDAYWIGETPSAVRGTRPLQSRWSVETVHKGLPVLISATTDWSDRVALSLALLVARPRRRDPFALRQLPAAKRLLAMGFRLEPEYAGVALERAKVPMHELSLQALAEAVEAAHELVEAQ